LRLLPPEPRETVALPPDHNTLPSGSGRSAACEHILETRGASSADGRDPRVVRQSKTRWVEISVRIVFVARRPRHGASRDVPGNVRETPPGKPWSSGASRVDIARRLWWRARASCVTGYAQGLGEGRCGTRNGHRTTVTRAEREEPPWSPGCSGVETF